MILSSSRRAVSVQGVMSTVHRLVRVEKIVRRKMFGKSTFDNTFDDFGYK